MRKAHLIILTTAMALALAGCGGKDKKLTRFPKGGEGPNEFTIMPTKPLQPPSSFTDLPPPTPGAANLVDTNPKAEGIAALGGNPASLGRGVAPSDGGLVNYAGRRGVAPGIRQTLAREDEAIRRRHGRVDILRISPVDDYTNAYKRQWLDPYAERQRLLRGGIPTPSAPPPE